MKKEICTSPAFFAAKMAAGGGTLVHLFGLTNVMHNHDNVGAVMSLGAGVSSGRWVLEILHRVLSKLGLIYNLPLVNGILYILCLALVAGITVQVLELNSKRQAALVGMLLVTFPTVTSTMFFRFTAPAYGISALLAAVAVWVLPRRIWGIPASAICIALSLGIYQGYIPFTIALFLLVLLKECLGGTKTKQVICQGLCDCAALLLGLLMYFVCLKVCLRVFGATLTDYQDIQNMGKLSLREMPSLVLRTYRNFLLLPIEDYCGLASFPLVRLCYGLLWILSPAGLLFCKKKDNRLIMLALLALFPMAANFIVIMCPQSIIHTLMIYGFVLGPIVPLLLWKAYPRIQKAIGALLICLICLNSYYANVNYTTLYNATVQMEHYLNSLVTQVRMTPGYDTNKRWAMIGQHWDPQLEFAWRSGLTYGGNSIPAYLMNLPTRDTWFFGAMGYSLPIVSDAEEAALAQTEEVKAMPTYPNYGSIRITEDMVIIKFGES